MGMSSPDDAKATGIQHVGATTIPSAFRPCPSAIDDAPGTRVIGCVLSPTSMNSPPGQQLTTELQDATPQDTASKPRVSIGKLQKPTARSERVVRSMKPRKLGVTNNLRRLEGGPSRDVFDPLSSPEKEKCRPRPRQLEVWDRTISPRRNEARRVNQPVRRERYAMLDAAPVLKATDQGSAHDSPR